MHLQLQLCTSIHAYLEVVQYDLHMQIVGMKWASGPQIPHCCPSRVQKNTLEWDFESIGFDSQSSLLLMRLPRPTTEGFRGHFMDNLAVGHWFFKTSRQAWGFLAKQNRITGATIIIPFGELTWKRKITSVINHWGGIVHFQVFIGNGYKTMVNFPYRRPAVRFTRQYHWVRAASAAWMLACPHDKFETLSTN